MDVIIVCHTELGYVNGKEVIFDKGHSEGTSEGVRNLAKLADKHGAKVTFAVAPEAAPFFPKDIKHEIGLHVHPGWEEFSGNGVKWFVGDQYLRQNCSVKNKSTALKDYTYKEQFELISKAKERIFEILNVEPRAFVAGRWSLNQDTIKVLSQIGITHECSALPSRKLSQVDWSKLPRLCEPYRPAENDYQIEGSLPITIVPVSQTWLAGEINPERAIVYGFPWMKACFKEYYQNKAPVFHIAIHSPSMTSDYFVNLFDNFLSFISQHPDIKFKFATEIKAGSINNKKKRIIPYLTAINFTLFKSIINKLISLAKA
jgi:peptidoglycan/xylan/chitin deacetylase (PgdA/CDA1 family)